MYMLTSQELKLVLKCNFFYLLFEGCTVGRNIGDTCGTEIEMLEGGGFGKKILKIAI